jgi:hypothetical protein
MAKRVRDILLDIDSGDIQLSSESNQSLNYYEIIWGSLFNDDGDTLYANIYIPSYNISSMRADSAGRYKLNLHTTYQPKATPFQIRLVTKVDGVYERISQASCRYPVVSNAYLPGGNQLRINASELIFINLDGYYVAEFVFGTESNTAFIYSAGNADLGIGISDEQSAQLLSLCAPGKYYRYPLTGVDITRYINTVVGYTDFSRRISEEFEKDGIDADSIDFDSATGKIDVVFKHEEGVDSPEVLVDPAYLGLEDVDITDALISSIASDISLDDLDVDYDNLDFDYDIPSAILESCFANGIWIGAYPWTGAELWKGHE